MALKADDDLIPDEFKLSTSCYCAFWKVRPLLEAENSDAVSHNLILVTKQNNLVEIQNKIVKRVKSMKMSAICKVIIHSEYEPFYQFIVVLTLHDTAHLMDYESLEIMKVWNEVCNISSEDHSSCGRPSLTLSKLSGQISTVSREEFVVDSTDSYQEKSQVEAITALNKKLMSIIRVNESLKLEKCEKEKFIAQSTSEFLDSLSGSHNRNKESLKNDLRSSQELSKPYSSKSEETCPLELLSARQRIIHSKWVICLQLLNKSNRYLIHNPDLVLHTPSLGSLQYKTKVLKSYQKSKRSSNLRGSYNKDVIFEELKPPVLRPQKKAFLIGICDFPEFSSSQSVAISGLISFQVRRLQPVSEKEPFAEDRQIRFPPLTLNATNFDSVCANVKRVSGSAGLSFDLLILIAASKTNEMKIETLGSPLDHFEELVKNDQRIYKVPDLRDFFCFHTPDCPPLHLAAFLCKRVSPDRISLTSYTKDDNQAMILIHNLKKLLPLDAFISKDGKEESGQEEQLRINMMSKINASISKLKTAFEPKPVAAGKNTKKRLVEGTVSEEATEWGQDDYLKWRGELLRLSIEMENLNGKLNRL